MAHTSQVSDEDELAQQLEDCVCLYALICKRQPDIEPGVSATDDDSTRGNVDEDDSRDVEQEAAEDLKLLEEFDAEYERDKGRKLADIKSKLLDRLAESLARFKSYGHSGHRDAQHVSSSMMVLNHDGEIKTIIFAKNEGLDPADEAFLNDWLAFIKTVSAKREHTSPLRTQADFSADRVEENDRTAILDAVFRHQGPRIKTCLKWLHEAFRTNVEPRGGLESVPLLPYQASRIWEDDNGLKFDFQLCSDGAYRELSLAAPSGRSCASEEDQREHLFAQLKVLGGTSRTDPPSQLIKGLSQNIFFAWRSAKQRLALRSRIRCHFEGRPKASATVEKAILALYKIYRCAHVFLEAAVKLPFAASCTWVNVDPKSLPPLRTTEPSESGPLTALARLGLEFKDPYWQEFFQKMEGTYKTLVRQRRAKAFVHAELQALHHYRRHVADTKNTVHPYIGCSRRCCSLCHIVITGDGEFTARGGHEHVMHRWNLPSSSSASKVVAFLKALLAHVLGSVRIRDTRPLLAQSSIAASTAEFISLQESVKLERPHRERQQMMMMPTRANGTLLVLQDYTHPEISSVQGLDHSSVQRMTTEKAELEQLQQLRRALDLEPLGEMRVKTVAPDIRPCRRCRQPSRSQCAACRTAYCSKSCQAKAWRRHVFVCCVRRRPNDVDHLRLLCYRWHKSRQDGRLRACTIRALFSDDHLCRTFGFNICITETDIENLFHIYRRVSAAVKVPELQAMVESGSLGLVLQLDNECAALTGPSPLTEWFCKMQQDDKCIPCPEEDFKSQSDAFLKALEKSNSEPETGNGPLDESSWLILDLYQILFREFNNIPGPCEKEWLLFGFCFCRDDAERKALRHAYLSLHETDTSLEKIATAWRAHALSSLMREKGSDLSSLADMSLRMRVPSQNEMGIYRLMAEVYHVLSGSFCWCFRANSCTAHSKYEFALSEESEGDYGFHGTNAWERWQLLNFYSYLFSLKDFCPEEMQAARRNSDPAALEEYIDSLLPGFQKSIVNFHLCDAMFPKLRAYVTFPDGQPDCDCVMHSTALPQGLSSFQFESILAIRGRNKIETERAA